MKELTTGDILEITDETVFGLTVDIPHKGGLTPKEFKTWLSKGIVKPISGGKGKGQHARFSFVQAVAIVVGANWWRSGGSLEQVAAIVETITALDEPSLRRAVKSGKRLVLPLPQGCRMIKINTQVLTMFGVKRIGETLDLECVIPWVEQQIKELEKRPGNAVGRSRGTQSK